MQEQPTFGGPYNPDVVNANRPPAMPMGEDDYDVGARMAELFQPQTQSIDAFNDMARQYPTYEEPGKLKKIGAVALGTLGDLARPGSGKAGFDEMMGYGKHNRAVADWKTRIDPLESAANFERQANQSGRQFAQSTVSNELRQRKDESTARNNEEKTRIARLRSDVYKYKAENPNAKIIVKPGGNTIAVNPITGRTIMDFGPSGKMTDAEKIDMEQANALERIEANAENATELEGTRQTNRETNIGLQGEQNRLTRGTPTGNQAAATNRPETPNNTRIRQFNSAKELVARNPALAPFVKFNGTDFQVIPMNPNPGFFSRPAPNQQQYNQIIEAIYGAPRPMTSRDTGEKPPAVQQTRIPPPTGARNQEQNNADRRNRAIQILREAGKQVTPATIDAVLQRMP